MQAKSCNRRDSCLSSFFLKDNKSLEYFFKLRIYYFFMKKLKSVKKKFVVSLIFSVIISLVLIVHGIFFDVDFAQIKRLSVEGFFLTFIIVFPSLLLLEWIFDLEDREEFKILEKRVSNLERKSNRKKGEIIS